MSRSQLLQRLADQLTSIKRPHPIRVAIDGVDAAGKTLLADELILPLRERGYPIIRASIDGFHNPRKIRYKRGSTSPEGYYYDSFDYQAIKSLVLDPLGPNGNFQYQTAMFSFRADSPILSPIHRAPPEAILLFDGVFLLRPELYDYWDFKIFVEVSFEVSVERASRRDQILFGTAEAVKEQYWQRYVPGQQIYIQNCRPRERADVVIENNDPVNPTMYFQAKNSRQGRTDAKD
jgi:uridine kinase